MAENNFPKYIDKKAERLVGYGQYLDIYNGDAYKVFNFNIYPFVFTKEDYISYQLLTSAVNIKTDLIWLEPPVISFENEQTQEEFNKLRDSSMFNKKMKIATKSKFFLGDSVIKIAIDDNEFSNLKDDKKLAIYNVDPKIWFPKYREYNYSKYPEQQTILYEIEEKDENGKKVEYYLLETYKKSQIIYTAYKEVDNKYVQINPLDKFDFLNDVLVSSVDGLTYIYETGADYPLVYFFQNNRGTDCFFGKSDLTQSAISKIKAINGYSTFAKFVLFRNSNPPMSLSEKALKAIKQIKSRVASDSTGGNEQSGLNMLEGINSWRDVIDSPFQVSLLENIETKKIFENTVFPADPSAKNEFLSNPFDIKQIQDEREKLISSLMSEFDISEVFYNPSISTGAKTGVAYKRLMTLTLNAVERTKQELAEQLPYICYTMLQLAKDNGLIDKSTVLELPTVNFKDGIINDESEILNYYIQAVQAGFASQKEAIMTLNDTDSSGAETIMQEIKATTVASQPAQPKSTVVDRLLAKSTANIDTTAQL